MSLKNNSEHKNRFITIPIIYDGPSSCCCCWKKKEERSLVCTAPHEGFGAAMGKQKLSECVIERAIESGWRRRWLYCVPTTFAHSISISFFFNKKERHTTETKIHPRIVERKTGRALIAQVFTNALHVKRSAGAVDQQFPSRHLPDSITFSTWT